MGILGLEALSGHSRRAVAHAPSRGCMADMQRIGLPAMTHCRNRRGIDVVTLLSAARDRRGHSLRSREVFVMSPTLSFFASRSLQALAGTVLLAGAVLTAPAPAHASTWQLMSPATAGAPAESTNFVDDLRDQRPARVPVSERWLLRSYDEQQSLGGLYPHRSTKLRYQVDCRTRAVALTDWEFREGSLGDGRVVWADTMGDTVFIQPVARSAEAQLVAATCAR
jgi:hypothetical protein